MPDHNPHLCPECDAPLDARGCCDEHGPVLDGDGEQTSATHESNGHEPRAEQRSEGRDERDGGGEPARREEPAASREDEDEDEDEDEGEDRSDQEQDRDGDGRRDGSREEAPALGFHVATDVIESDDELLVYVDAPGVGLDDLEVVLEDQLLTIRGERRCPYDADASEDGRRERAFGAFQRVLYVPRGLDPEAVDASFADGVLTVRIPRSEPPEPHVIKVSGGGRRRRAAGQKR